MKKLFIDLEICNKCEECKVDCSYFYHPQNNGITTLRELAAFATVCRQCEEAPCVKACPQDALEKQEDGTLKRYNMRCIGCKSCVLACPFGTIYPEVIPHLVSQCDYCLNRLNGKIPECVNTCPFEAVKYADIEEDVKENIFAVGKNLVVHSIPWEKKT